MREPVAGAGHSVASVDGPDEGYGFREVHKELGVGDLGVDAIVVTAGFESRLHADRPSGD